jgi:hypothetical protein
MRENLFRHINIREENVHIPDGNTSDIPGFCQAYEDKIRAVGGIDLQILGIGTVAKGTCLQPIQGIILGTGIHIGLGNHYPHISQ